MDLTTYHSQAFIDMIGKGRKFRRIPLETEAFLAIKDYLEDLAKLTIAHRLVDIEQDNQDKLFLQRKLSIIEYR